MFSGGSGYHIYGGNFYHVSGDVNLDNHQHLALPAERLLEAAPAEEPQHDSLSLRFAEDEVGRELPGPSRHPRRAGVRRQPFETSSRDFISPSSRFDRDSSPDRGVPSSGSRLTSGAYPALVIHANNVNHNHNGEMGLDILHRSVALDALYDSAESFPQPRCHPETRTEILDDLHGWALDVRSEQPICWLHGPAGAGKSAIMQTLYRRLEQESRLGGSFFFKRGPAPRGNAKMLFATLAYQLAINSHHPELKRLILQRVERNPSIVARDMDVQLRELIVEPYLALKKAPEPIILLIDGLDECASEEAQERVLRLVADTAHQHPRAFRFLFACRPEAHIREVLDDARLQGILYAVNIEQSFDDVRIYLQDEFSRIHREHKGTMSHIPTPWPSDTVIDALVEKSSGYFIYASTVIKFIDDKYFRPIERLAIIQNLVTSNDSGSPLRALDALYTEILSKVPVQHREKLSLVLCAVKANLGLHVDLVEQLLGLESGEFMLILRGLYSLIKVPFCLDGSLEFSFHHASFLDYLGNPARSSIFHVGEKHHTKLACSILNALSFGVDEPLACTLRQQNHPFMQRAENETRWAKYIFSIRPSKELIPYLSLLNPDHLGWRTYPHFARGTVEMSRWLQNIQPTPEKLIQRWQDYRFLAFYEWLTLKILGELARGWNNLNDHAISGIKLPCRVLQPSLEQIIRIESKMGLRQPSPGASKPPSLPASPPLRRILYALLLLYTDKQHTMEIFAHRDGIENCSLLFTIRWLLDMSWEEMATALGPLHSILEQDPLKLCRVLLEIPHLRQELHAMVSRDLALGVLCTLRLPNISLDPSPRYHRLSKIEVWGLPWGKYVRASPPCDPDVLFELCTFNPLNPFKRYQLHAGNYQLFQQIEFHDAWQWLKTLPVALQVPNANRWQSLSSKYSEEILEQRWQEELKLATGLQSPSQPDEDLKVISSWDGIPHIIQATWSLYKEFGPQREGLHYWQII